MLKNEILLIPIKKDIERESVAQTWTNLGGEVLRVDKFWVKPFIEPNKRITIYGNDTFSLVLAQILELELLEPKYEYIAELDDKWIKRKIEIDTLTKVKGINFPIFIKPVKPKLFQSKVYQSYDEFLDNAQNINSNEPLIISEIISIQSEIRAFVYRDEVLDMAIYEGNAKLDQGKQFLKAFIQIHSENLPLSYVVDIGFNQNEGWFIIEFNASWGAGLNFCDPSKIINAIRGATIN